MSSSSKSKRMKKETASSSSSVTSAKSTLSQEVQRALRKVSRDALDNGVVIFNSVKIDDDMVPEVYIEISKLGNKVNELRNRLNRNCITSQGAIKLFDLLRANNSSIQSICLEEMKKIDDECIKSLGEFIKYNNSIKKLALRTVGVSDTGIEILAPYLEGNITFKTLDIRHNKDITDAALPHIMKIIDISHIERIDVQSTSLKDMRALVAPLICNRLKSGEVKLNISFRQLNDDELIKICNAMKKHGIDKLKELNLGGNKITSKGASVLFNTLKECNSVVSNLNLSQNQLDDECMKQLGEFVQDNEYVEELKLTSNKITDKGVEILSECLIGNTTFKQLNLNDNKGITDASAPHLIEIAHRSCITNLDVSYTSISGEKELEIYKALSIPIDGREIPIKSNTKSAAKIQSSSTSTSESA